MFFRKTILLSVAAFAGADIASQTNVPVEYYIGTITVIGAFTAAIRMWEWHKKKIRTMIYETTLEMRHDIQRLTETIRTLQCVRQQVCDDRERPAITPLGLPVIKKED